MNRVAYWWNNPEIEIYEIEGKYIALFGWNGEKYIDCWEVAEIIGDEGFDIKSKGYIVRPVYESKGEDLEVIGYEIEP